MSLFTQKGFFVIIHSVTFPVQEILVQAVNCKQLTSQYKFKAFRVNA